MGEDKDLVPVTGVNIKEAKRQRPSLEHIWEGPNVVEVPAADGKEPLFVLAKPAYFLVDHGVTLISYQDDNPVDRRARPILHAAYLAGMGSGSEKEMRVLSFPAAFFPGQDRYNNALLGEIRSQGISEEDARRAGDLRNAQAIFGYLDVRELPTMRFLMKGRQFKKESPDPEMDAKVLKSGWGEVRLGREEHKEYVIVGDPQRIIRKDDDYYFREQGIYWNLEHKTFEQWNTGIRPISEPYSEQSASAEDTAIVEKIMGANL